jgi:cell division protein FtsB
MSAQQRIARLARLVPTGRTPAARAPFVLLIVLLLGTGLLALLLLNASLNKGSFQLTKLEKETEELTDQQQELQQQVDGYSAPDRLAERARERGLVPSGNPVFLNPDGTVRGAPGTPDSRSTASRSTDGRTATSQSAGSRSAATPSAGPPSADSPSGARQNTAQEGP